MKITEFVVVVIAALLFLLPGMKQDSPFSNEIQAEEEAPPQKKFDAYRPRSFKITYRVTNPRLEHVADIVWMKKAAEVAKKAGIPYFNIIEQDISKEFNREAGQELSIISGVIQLDPDPMRAEFDAQEIDSLVLTEYP